MTNNRSPHPLLLAILLLLAASCGPKKTKVITPRGYLEARTASLQELVDRINIDYAAADRLIVAKARVDFAGGSVEIGYLEEYPSAPGYLIASRDSSIYLNILNPLTKSTVITMASTAGRFQTWIPRENKYVTGPSNLDTNQEKPIYNVRPEHLLDAILIEPVPINDTRYKYFVQEEQDPDRKYYLMEIIRVEEDSPVACLERRMWIERARLELVRQQYYECGGLRSTITYSKPVRLDGTIFNTRVTVDRVREHYQLALEMNPESVRINPELKEGTFQIPVPPGAELVEVGEEPVAAAPPSGLHGIRETLKGSI